MNDDAAPATKQAHVNHFSGDGDFKQDGLRKYALYRDLGLAKASDGLVQAHVIRMVPPCTDEVRKRHYHDTKIQMTYVLKGWIKIKFEGQEEVTLNAGSICLLPPKIKHTVMDYSDDCEQIEIISPAVFDTVPA
jgi:uncharacterized RmlC-like cupin family protein